MARRSAPSVLLFAVLFFSFAYFHQGGFSNQNSRADLTFAIAFEGRPEIDSFHENTIDKARLGDHYYSEKSPVASYLALPAALVARPFVSRDDLVATPRGNALLHFVTVFSVGLLSAFSAVAFARTVRLVHPAFGAADAALLTFVVYVATLLLPYSTMLFSHAVASSWLTLSLFHVARLLGVATRDGPALSRDAFLGALLLSLAAVTEYPIALVAGTIGLALAFRLRTIPRALVPFGFGAVAPVAIVLAHNRWSFGGALRLGYGQLGATQWGAAMGSGLFGIHRPSPIVIANLLFGEYRGFFAYAPLLLLGAFGLAMRASDRAIPGTIFARTLSIAAICLVVAISGYTFWEGGTCYGPRHLVALTPLVAIGIAMLSPAILRAFWFWALAVPSVGISLIGTVLTPFVAEYEHIPRRAYLHLLATGDVSVTPL